MNFNNLLEIREDIWTYLAKSKKKIVMYGTGNGADKILNVFEAKGIKLYGIFASDDFVRDRSFRGYKVKHYKDFCDEIDDFIVVVSFASQRDEVLDNIYKIASERELYAPDVPVYGEGLFDLKYFNEHKDRLYSVYSLMADDLSAETFIKTLAYKLTGKITYLRECETTPEEIYELLGRTITNKNCLDIGAYTGDTVEEYVNHFGNDMEIYAIEPDKKNYEKMLQRFSEKNIKSFHLNIAAWNRSEILRFKSKSGRSGTVVNEASAKNYSEVTAKCIDDYEFDNIGYIKIDAEGTDLKAITGMKKLIANQSPCIKVAAYHRNDDYFVIPETIKSIDGSFRLYMRHLKYVPAWDTDFIFQFFKN